jgi:hypothetical protein
MNNKLMPWTLKLDNDDLDALMFAVSESIICDEYEKGICDKFDILFGNSEEIMRFCPYHYFRMNKLTNDGLNDWKLILH